MILTQEDLDQTITVKQAMKYVPNTDWHETDHGHGRSKHLRRVWGQRGRIPIQQFLDSDLRPFVKLHLLLKMFLSASDLWLVPRCVMLAHGQEDQDRLASSTYVNEVCKHMIGYLLPHDSSPESTIAEKKVGP